MRDGYQKAVIAGAVAGVVGGIVAVIFGAIGLSIGLYQAGPVPMANIVAAIIVLTIIFGAIFGAIYSKLYDSLPGVGILKGLYFGLLLLLIKDVLNGLYIVFATANVNYVIGSIWIGIFLHPVFGSVLGALYRK